MPILFQSSYPSINKQKSKIAKKNSCYYWCSEWGVSSSQHLCDRGCGVVIFLFNQTRISMLDFTTQKKLLEPILKHPSNQHCADCNSVAPTCTSLMIQGSLSISEYFFAPTVRVPTAASALQSLGFDQPTSTSGNRNGSKTCELETNN